MSDPRVDGYAQTSAGNPTHYHVGGKYPHWGRGVPSSYGVTMEPGVWFPEVEAARLIEAERKLAELNEQAPEAHAAVVRTLRSVERKTDEWRDKAFDALDALKTANDNCERLQAERDEARAALTRVLTYPAIHQRGCGLRNRGIACTCGLAEALAGGTP